MKNLLLLLAFSFLLSISFADFTHLRTIDGTGESRTSNVNNFTAPWGLAFYNGYLYVADESSRFIYKMSNNTAVSRAGGLGVLDGPRSIAINPQNGNIYTGDIGGATVRALLGSTQAVRVGLAQEFPLPSSLFIEGNVLYILDSSIPKISAYSLELGSTYSSHSFTVNGDGGLSNPTDMWKYNGNYYIADTDKDRIAVFDSNFTFLQSIGKGKGGVSLWRPKGVFVYDDMVFVSDTLSDRVVVFSLDGYPLETLSGNFSKPTDIIVQDGTLYFTDSAYKRVQAYSIGEIGGNVSVLGLISSANASVSKLQSLVLVAQKLSIAASSSDAQSNLADAVSSYDAYRYSDAADQSREAKDLADSQYSSLSQQATIKIRQLSGTAASTMAAYNESSTPQYLLANRTAILSKISQVDNFIAIGNYNDAADLALSLPALASSFAQAADSGSAAAQNLELEQQKQHYYSSIAQAQDSLSNLSAQASASKLPIESGQVSSLLDIARSKVAAGQLEEANATLSQALSQLSSLSSSLGAKLATMQPALDAIAAANAQISSLEEQKLIFYPNMQPARSLISQAYAQAPLDSQTAIALSNDALSAATKEASNARTLSYIAIAIGGLALIMVLVAGGVVAYLYKRRRRRL